VKEADKAALAKALGASRRVELSGSKPAGPLDLLSLREEFDRRLRSSGGRPTDPSWTVSRQVPFKEVSWERLRAVADEVGRVGPRVGPAQVAALLVERSLEDETDWREVLHRSRELPLLPERDAAAAAGVTYRQFDHWYAKGWLFPARRRGRLADFSVDEVMRARWLRAVPQISRDTLAPLMREQDIGHRFLVATDTTEVTTARSRHQLLDLIERPGDHTVIDQVALRRPLLVNVPEPEEETRGRPVRKVG
jgi:hypothetical protein